MRDHGHDTIEIGSSSRGKIYNLEEVAILIGWISLDDYKKYDAPINFNAPPGPIINLPGALRLIVKDLKKLHIAFSYGKIESTRSDKKHS